MNEVLCCREAGIICNFCCRGETEGEVLKVCREHIERAHQFQVTANLAKSLRPKIKAE